MPDEVAPGAVLPSAARLLAGIADSWPPHVPGDGRGYRQTQMAHAHAIAALDLDGSGGQALAVVASGADMAALPLVRSDEGWRVAAAGDGTSVALARLLARLDGPAPVDVGIGFSLSRDLDFAAPGVRERALLADQSNHSVVVGETVLVKWRTAFGADGERASLLRRHLRAVGHDEVPPLLGTVSWHDGHGQSVVLADLDAYLADAVDGWDRCIAALLAAMDEGPPASLEASDLAPRLGHMTASLHVALAQPSPLIPVPRETVGEDVIANWASQGRAAVDAAYEIGAPDQHDVVARRRLLLEDITRLGSIKRTPVQPIHGDLHIGQLLAWRGGLAFIDFDGPPGVSSQGLALEPTARDVAQMLVALANLAAAVDHRTDGRHASTLEAWAARAQADYLAAYRGSLAHEGLATILDERLLAPFFAEQLCRELVYAAQTLPRWRYAPMTALRWRYPEEVP